LPTDYLAVATSGKVVDETSHVVLGREISKLTFNTEYISVRHLVGQCVVGSIQ